MKVSTRVSNTRKGHYARILMAAALLAAFSPAAWAQYNTLGRDFTVRTGTTSATSVERIRVTQAGLMGIGHTNPSYTLDISGTARATRFIGDGSGLTNLPGQNIISGTTTMVQGWPDAIVCTLQNGSNGTDTRVFHLSFAPFYTGQYFYRLNEQTVVVNGPTSGGVSTQIGFTASGSYASFDTTYTSYTSAGTCANKTISQLYTEGKAFNFIGNTGMGDAGGLGYAMTSGTLSVTANTSGIVSLTTAGTTWGYLGSNGSYLPKLNTDNISATTINGVPVSSLGSGASPTNVPAFRAHRNGTDQSLPTSTYTNITWTTEEFDTYSNFSTSTGRFTPTVAGYYNIHLSIGCLNLASTNACVARILKNGAAVTHSNVRSPQFDVTAHSSVIVYLNGAGDYVTAQALSEASSASLTGNGANTYFEAALIASGNGLVSGTGASALSAMSDVTLASPATGEILTYNGTKWVNSTPTTNPTISGTTTMMEGWPDAIFCSDNSYGSDYLFHTGIRGTNHVYAPTWETQNGNFIITYNPSGGYVSGSAVIAGTCANKSISQLYTEGKAYNFIGNSGANGNSDRIASGTTSIVAETGGLIRINTSGVNTAYFDTVGRLVVPGISTTGIISGTGGYFSGNLGISGRLDVSNPANTTLQVMATNSGVRGGMSSDIPSGSAFYMGSYSNSPLALGINNSERMRIGTDGRVGIGTTSARAALDSPNGGIFNHISIGVCAYGPCPGPENQEYPYETIQLDPGNNLRISFGEYQPFFFGNNGHALKPGGGSWNAFSDKRLKDLDGTYPRGLKEIAALEPVRFHYKKNNQMGQPSDREFVGLIAQDVQPHFPEAVSKEKDGYYRLDTTPISFAVINAIKELKAENEQHRKANVQLQAENNRLQASNDNLARELRTFRSEYEAFKAKITSVVVIE
ncbi:tail fiber domain-containing protein [Agrobacterium sp. T29]|uniref:tail fiber domain-containing protein n=1 Tax=Agrobacterium sp. T29 TaxID=2580515 RepID=UPI00115E73FD|nr:tail fiber domain-containing protein [Agrobacterium sp. T29]